MKKLPFTYPVFIALVMTFAASLGYRYPLPNIYQVGHEIVITAECGCTWRDVEPTPYVEHEVRQITPWSVGITFTEQGIVETIGISCPKSVVDKVPVDIVKVDWMIRGIP